MESPPNDDDDDIKLVKASAGLLSDLEEALPKLLRKPPRKDNSRGRVHAQIRRRDLDYVIKLIEPFQGEPQLLDSKLKSILPPFSEAYVEYLRLSAGSQPKEHLDFQTAICTILYTLCKVRGYKVVLGFLNNEPRYLEPILEKIEDILSSGDESVTEWQVPYVLLLWLSHLLLTPFDLASISDHMSTGDSLASFPKLPNGFPPIAERLLLVGLKYLPVPTRAQDAAVRLLFRLVERPDMQKFSLADAVVSKARDSLQDQPSDIPVTIYERIGPLRLLAGITNSSELGYLSPSIYGTCVQLSEDEASSVATNAIAKKITVKIFRNVAILSLRSTSTGGPLLDFLETSNVLEEVIDYLLGSLGDRDTPVRYAAAKALSLIILELEADMGYEVIQAVLDAFKEDIPRNSAVLDFRAVNALKWHGLTLALAHILFKRSASPDQLPDIVNALVSALNFEQRTATGSSVGTNVRDAANFGIWSLSRRYTTKELLSVDTATIKGIDAEDESPSVIRCLATQLLLSACLDPAGNIRRGSSAALQEIIGRHPDQVYEGIALVQVVDYQAVGLRRRAMLDVANCAAELHVSYWTALFTAMFAWRGLGSADVTSREAAAASLARLSVFVFNHADVVLLQVMRHLRRCSATDAEGLHGLVLALAFLIAETTTGSSLGSVNGPHEPFKNYDFRSVLDILLDSTKDFSLRILRSELPSAISQLLAAVCQFLSACIASDQTFDAVLISNIETLTVRILSRHEDAVQQTIPPLVLSLLFLKRKIKAPLSIVGCQSMCRQVSLDASKSTLHGAGRAIALGALAPLYDDGLAGENALEAVTTLGNLTSAMNVDWRVIGIKALQLSIESCVGDESAESTIAGSIIQAVHHAMNDYTIDERGDVGSLVRLQAISCTSRIFRSPAFREHGDLLQILYADILRLSLEKLDRVRLAAAQCQRERRGFSTRTADVQSVSSQLYFTRNLAQITADEPPWKQTALLEGCISCAGISAEPLLQASRAALVEQLLTVSLEHLQHLLSTYASILKELLPESQNIHPALELLAFLLNMQVPQRIAESDFKWRNLLSTVQKSHHKSNDISKILAAVQVYGGLADIPSIYVEVLKKLISMLKTNPYPRVRLSVAEQLYIITKNPVLKDRDWMKPASRHSDVIHQLEERYTRS